MKNSLYRRASLILDDLQFNRWIDAKMKEAMKNAQVTQNVLKHFSDAWGEPGESGDPQKIKRNCELFSLSAARFLDLAEEAAFVSVPNEFEDVVLAFVDGITHPLKEFAEFPAKLRALIESIDKPGSYHLDMVLELPDGWAERMEVEIQRAVERLLQRTS